MNNYERKQEERKARYLALAEKAHKASESTFKVSSDIIGMIPMGQPVLVGHHSESAHRAALKRSDNAMRKGVKLERKEEHYKDKAASVGGGGISSDDENAIDKLRKKLGLLEEKQAAMKETNKKCRRDKTTQLFKPWELQNNNARIRACKARIAGLESAALAVPKETKYANVTVEECPGDNRIRLHFNGKPSDDIRQMLKRQGFRWSRSNMAWQRHLNNAGRYAADYVVKKIEEEERGNHE